YDLVLAGKESIDYNGGMVPGMTASLLGYNFVNANIGLEINDNIATISREIDGGKEILSANLPLVIAGQKGIVEEKDLRIPNMRGIMMARKKPLQVIEPVSFDVTTETKSFEKPEAKSACKMIDADNVEELVNLLHNEAKVI
ncbi:MAG: electron transfer flavoprotein beta subunit/FixA family protein, partial [Flavobacteriaceae bacterium]|nr:electron transfer flavoprotein beta subunit/FixA family protein [Flavobacteriaceae bacterium]